MTIFGLTIQRAKPPAVIKASPPMALSSVSAGSGWLRFAREAYAGAWQRNIECPVTDVLTNPTVFSCVSLIASDIAKMRIKLMQQDRHGIWTETNNSAYSAVLRDPNHYQNRIKFLEHWVTSKLIAGNTYVLKERDERRVVSKMYVLDPALVRPMVGSDGSVWYALSADNLSGIEGSVTVPASEIIHDVMVPLYHPLCGVSPLTASGLAAMQGLNVQRYGAVFFQNGSVPSGILTMPGTIDPEEQKLIQTNWTQQFSGDNSGRVAVLGGGMAYTQMTMTAVDAQLIDQLKWTSETICSTFHVPPYMIGVGSAPTYNNIEALNQQYYSQCLQNLIECIELLLDRGLSLANDLGTELDLDNLIRMDTATRVKAAADAIGSGAMSPNEARFRYFDLGPVTGGETPYLQQQNYSLLALSKRDSQADPFGSASPVPALPEPSAEDETPEDADKRLADLFRKELAMTTVC